jgi:hypothetical protein
MSSSREVNGRAAIVCALAAAALAAGCASRVPRPTEELARAQTLVEQAEQNNAQQYAAADISMARDKLQAANKAADKGNNEVAQRLASEASLDARLASARAASARTQRAATEVNQSVETLRREATRNTSSTNPSNTP